MHKHLLLVLILSMPFMALGQTWQAIAKGGISWNSTTSNYKGHDDHSWFGPMAAVGLSYRKDHIEIGVEGGHRRLAFRSEGDQYDFDPVTGYGTNPHHFRVIKKLPSMFVAPFANYHFRKGKLDYYAGVSPMYFRYTSGDMTIEEFFRSVKNGGNAYGLELCAGCAYPLTKRISAYSELGGGFVYLPVYFDKDAYMSTASLNLGLKLKL